MTEKQRLVELMKKCPDWAVFSVRNGFSADLDLLADYLLKNGVIVPPCKVGDTVWFHICFEKGCLSTAKGEVTAIVEREVEDFLEICSYNIIIGRSFDEVFPTREAAEKELKERETK